MKLIKLCRAITWLTLLALLAGLGAGLPINDSAHAQSKSPASAKLSPDLSERVHGGRGDARISAIIQFNSASSRQLDDLLLNYGAKVTSKLRNFHIQVASLPVNAIEALAARSEVRFISPDRQTGTFGHVTTTTGAEAVR